MERHLRDAAAALTWLAGGLGVVGLVLAYAQRSDPAPRLSVLALAACTTVGLASAVCGVASSRRPYGLRWPDGPIGSWPTWPWWWVVGAVGLVDIAAGPLVSGWLGLLGAMLLAAACAGLGRDLLRPPRAIDRTTVQAALTLRTAAGDSPDAAAAIAPVGAIGARVVVFAPTGRLADVVMPDAERAELAARVAGLRLVDAAELHPPLRTG